MKLLFKNIFLLFFYAIIRNFAMALSRYYYEYVQMDYQDAITGEPLIKAFTGNIITPPVEMLAIKVIIIMIN